MEHTIPLFPLKLVIFPQSSYPLHIFEPRYKKMIGKCLDRQIGFGIILQIGNEISKIGSYVRVESILKKYDSGEMDIVVKAATRFILDKIDLHEDGYFTAVVNEYSDIELTVDTTLLNSTTNKFREFIDKINLELDEKFWINFRISVVKSFKIAEKSGLTISEQQELLIIQDENTRLRFLNDHFERITQQVRDNLKDKIIAMNDGFIN